MRILITGANGRLGSQIVQQLQETQVDTVTGIDIDSVNITDSASVQQLFESVKPELVIHCAALTAVDYCAEHPDEALAVNGMGTQIMAQMCQSTDAAMLFVSTNEVFDGKERRTYLEYDRPAPINAYGYSKWVGEQVVRDLVRKHFIVRTSWLFAHGGRNFIQTILRMANENKPLRIVVNELSSPTYNDDLAGAIIRLVATGRYGIYHLVNEGQCSRYQFARHILNLAGYTETPIEPIALAEYRRASCPPEHAVLRNFAAAQLGITLRSWQEALAAFFETEQIR